MIHFLPKLWCVPKLKCTEQRETNAVVPSFLALQVLPATARARLLTCMGCTQVPCAGLLQARKCVSMATLFEHTTA